MLRFLATKYGWESVFYVFGTIGVIWYITWLVFVKAGPELDRFCSKEECDYIQKTIGYVGSKHVKHPWRAIFTSMPFYAIMASHFSENWGFYTLLTQLPSFLRGKCFVEILMKLVLIVAFTFTYTY